LPELTEINSIDVPPTDFHPAPKTDADKLEALKQHPLFGQLTLKQQDFLLRYIEYKGNGRRAAKTVFKTKDDKSADYQSRKLLRRWEVRKLLTVYGKFSFEGYLMNRDEALHLISEKLRDAIDIKSFVDLMRFLSKLQGWEDRKIAPDADADDEGEDTASISDDDVQRMVLGMEKARK
jgi:hypothetical protein